MSVFGWLSPGRESLSDGVLEDRLIVRNEVLDPFSLSLSREDTLSCSSSSLSLWSPDANN